jgi:hypothetical protein
MFGYGFGFVGLILYMMQVVAPGKYQTAHYAFATGIMQLGFVLFKLFSGDIQIALGYQHFFIWVMLSAIPVAVLSQLIPMTARPQDEGRTASRVSGTGGVSAWPASVSATSSSITIKRRSSTASTSISPTANSWSSSARRAAASPPCCA